MEMKVNEDFLRIYNATFKFIHERLSKKAVRDYWKTIAPLALYDLKEALIDDGLYGCVRYWDDVMSAEGAEYQIIYNADKFTMNITRCPSLTKLDRPYEDYCEHCKVMYSPLFKCIGYIYKTKKTGEKSCKVTVCKS